MSLRRTLAVCLLLAAPTSVSPALADSPCDGNTTYFVVARPGMYPLLGDSYILPLTDPADIDVARAVADGGGVGGPIVVATVVPGDGGYNRDMLAPEGHRWSWHVSEFLEFTQMAAEICDGNPTMTESQAQNWQPGTEETICYWSYSVVEEIDCAVPVAAASWGTVKTWYRTPSD